MITYQDLMKVPERELTMTVKQIIEEHKSSIEYRTAVIANDYDNKKNRTILNFRKMLYNLAGKAVPDNYSANYKIPSGFFNRFTTQENQFLLGKGCIWTESDTKEKLGSDFDEKLKDIGKAALVEGVAFGFWNYDHLEVFKLSEFAPIYDEENGALMAGVKFWQIDSTKPLRATFYEIDGYTEYIWDDVTPDGRILKDKKTYIQKIVSTKADGSIIYDGENYPTFPIVPLWANDSKQSELVGIREGIDCYDLVKSGFANDIDDAQQIFWILQNAGGMDEVDIRKFLSRLKTVKAAVVDGEDGAKAEPHTVEIPTEARERLLDRIEKDLYKDYMALDTDRIASGSVAIVQIMAAYEPLNHKADLFEKWVKKFINGILYLAEINDTVTFERSYINNTTEMVQTLLLCATYLPREYVAKKIVNILGDGEKAEEILEQMANEDLMIEE